MCCLSESGETSRSEHGEVIQAHDDFLVAQNHPNVILEPWQETIVEIQRMGDINNEEGVQCGEHSTPTINVAPPKKRTKRIDMC